MVMKPVFYQRISGGNAASERLCEKPIAQLPNISYAKEERSNGSMVLKVQLLVFVARSTILM